MSNEEKFRKYIESLDNEDLFALYENKFGLIRMEHNLENWFNYQNEENQKIILKELIK